MHIIFDLKIRFKETLKKFNTGTQRHMSKSILEGHVCFILKLQVQNVELITLLNSYTSKESIGQRENRSGK